MLTALPKPWSLGLLLKQEEDGKFHIGVLPVIALCDTDDYDEHMPVVACNNGRIVSARKLIAENIAQKWEVLFLVGPEEDPRKVAQLALAARGYEPVEGSELDIEIDSALPTTN